MRHIKIVLLLVVVSVFSLFVSARVITAFSVGHLTVKENSERGFVAEVPFELTDHERAKSVEVSLGGPGHYALLGEQRPGELDGMKVRVDRQRGKAYIESNSPLRAPLDLVVKVTVDGGTILKRFPIALKSTLERTVAKTASDKPEYVAGHPQGATAGAGIVGGVYGPVRSGETLSEIGVKVAGNRLPLEKVVVALWQNNRDKFAFGNLHALRANAYLDCSNLDAAVAGISLEQARQTIHDQWQEWKKIKVVRAASRKPTPPLVVGVVAPVGGDVQGVEQQNVEEVKVSAQASPMVRIVQFRPDVASEAGRREQDGLTATTEGSVRRMVLARRDMIGSLAQAQMSMAQPTEVRVEEAPVQPAAAEDAGLVAESAEEAMAADLSKLREEMESTKELLLGRIGGLEGKFAGRFLRSEKLDQLFYAIFLVENLVLLVILLVSMRRRRTRELMRREEQPARGKVYVRNALNQRYL